MDKIENDHQNRKNISYLDDVHVLTVLPRFAILGTSPLSLQNYLPISK